jgi:hypothetical protein
MKQKLATGALFALIIVAGGLAASAVAEMGPSSALQTTTTTVPTVTTTTTTDTTTTTPTPRKITICHHTKGKKGTKHVTIRINRSAWKAHQRHGDSLGACNTVAAKKFHSRAAHVKKFHKKKK